MWQFQAANTGMMNSKQNSVYEALNTVSLSIFAFICTISAFVFDQNSIIIEVGCMLALLILVFVSVTGKRYRLMKCHWVDFLQHNTALHLSSLVMFGVLLTNWCLPVNLKTTIALVLMMLGISIDALVLTSIISQPKSQDIMDR